MFSPKRRRFEYDCGSFMTAVERGTGGGETAVLPTAPVVYAAVGGGVTAALVPLQIKLVSVKINSEANPDPSSSSSPSSSTISVRFKASWLLEGHLSTSPLLLAVPVGPRGRLLSYEVKRSYYSKSALHKVELDANCKPELHNLYLVSLPPVEAFKRDMEIGVLVCYIQDFDRIDFEQGLYSFRVPLSIPSYVTRRPSKILRAQKIRLILHCRGAGTITDCDVTSHPLIDIITHERRRVFLQESRRYSDKDLTCSFRVTSPTINQAKLFLHEMSFVRAVEEGLKLMCGSGELSFTPQSMLPTAPVLYAVVSNTDIMDFDTTGADRAFQLPALVPLKMRSLSLKVTAEPKPDSVHIQFKGRWSVHCIKKGNTCPLILAIPVGRRGCLLRYEIHVTPHNPKVQKTEEFTARNGPQFRNLYLVALPPCEGGADVFIRFCYVQDVIQNQGLFSFTIPLSVPNYVCQIAEMSSRKERIRLTLECKDTGTITKCDVPSHHLLELISNEKMRVLVNESLGYSGKDLTCSFMATGGFKIVLMTPFREDILVVTFLQFDLRNGNEYSRVAAGPGEREKLINSRGSLLIDQLLGCCQ